MSRPCPRGSRGFSASARVAMGVGLGVGLPVLGIARGMLLRTSPYGDPLLHEAPGAEDWFPGWSAARQPITAAQDAGLRALGWLLLALTLLLLGIALVNLLTALLARAAALRAETALRAPLGAERRQLTEDLLTWGAPGLLLGGGLGLAGGLLAACLLRTAWPGGAPPWSGLGVEAGGLATMLGLFVLVPALAWLSPAAVAWRTDLRRFLTAGGRSTPGPGEVFGRELLAVVQVAASLVLLTCAALLIRAFVLAAAGGGEVGLDPRATLAVQLRLGGTAAAGLPERRALLTALQHRIGEIPGVAASSLATSGTWLGLGPTDRVTALCPECGIGTMIRAVSRGEARIHAVSPGFFGAIGARVLRSREPGAADQADGGRAAVINRTFAYRLFPNGEPLGKSVRVGGESGEWHTVVGVVDDVRAQAIGSGAAPVPAIYLSTLQHPPRVVELTVRTTGDPMRLLPVVERVVRATIPGATLTAPMPLVQYLDRFRAPLRWFALLFGALAALALLLAASGLDGMMSYHVTRRTREIGIRMVLGARSADVTRLVLRQSLRLTGTGVMLGLIAALSLARLLQLLFRGVEPFDPLLFGGIALLLGGVALVGSQRPARRAAAVDPQLSLRAE